MREMLCCMSRTCSSFPLSPPVLSKPFCGASPFPYHRTFYAFFSSYSLVTQVLMVSLVPQVVLVQWEYPVSLIIKPTYLKLILLFFLALGLWGAAGLCRERNLVGFSCIQFFLILFHTHKLLRNLLVLMSGVQGVERVGRHWGETVKYRNVENGQKLHRRCVNAELSNLGLRVREGNI